MQSPEFASEINLKRATGSVHVLYLSELEQKTSLEKVFEEAKSMFISNGLTFEEFERHLKEIDDKEFAKSILEIILWKDLAYGEMTMQRNEASYFVNSFFDSFGKSVRCFTNSTWEYDQNQEPKLTSWYSLTKATFDCGLLIIGYDKAGAIWVEDED